LRPSSRWRPRRPPGSPMLKAGPDIVYAKAKKKKKNLISQTNFEKLVHAFMSSRLDKCNALFVGLSKQSVGRLDNAAARDFTQKKQNFNILLQY